MKIIHIIFSLNIGGAENMLIDIINEQVLLNYEVELIIINDDINNTLLETIDNKVLIRRLKRPSKSKNPYYFIKLYFILFYSKATIVHCHNSIMGKILKYYNKKKIITIHCTGAAQAELINFDKVISISDTVKEDLFNNNISNVETIINGIACKNILIKDLQKKRDNDYNIIQIGRLEYIKGQDIAIKAISELIEKGIKINLTLIGQGTYQNYLLDLVKDLNIQDNIIFAGALKKSEIYKQIKNYDILIQPSREEGFGLTIIEGMAAKIPVLVSDIKGPNEVVLNGKLGTIFKTENVDDLVNKILYIIEKDVDELKIENAYQYTINNYSINKTVENYIRIYKELENMEIL